MEKLQTLATVLEDLIAKLRSNPVAYTQSPAVETVTLANNGVGQITIKCDHSIRILRVDVSSGDVTFAIQGFPGYAKWGAGKFTPHLLKKIIINKEHRQANNKQSTLVARYLNSVFGL